MSNPLCKYFECNLENPSNMSPFEVELDIHVDLIIEECGTLNNKRVVLDDRALWGLVVHS